MSIRKNPAKTTLINPDGDISASSHFIEMTAPSHPLPAPAAVAAIAAAAVPERAEGELLVQFIGGAGSEGRMKALAAVSGEPLEVLWSDGDAQLVRVQLTGKFGTDKAIEMLAKQPGVKFAEANYLLNNQATSNDSQYTSGGLWGMRGDTSGSFFGTGADEAWADGYTGSMKTVVGVIDSGIDYRHQDLYLNIWLNQREISTTLRTALTDTDSDGLITFRDLNHVANQSQVSDLNANGYIDAGDLLNDARWEDGVDNEGNGYTDDLIGWDFVNNDNDPLDDNRHGTHVAGTIGGVGGNGTGVVGVNWSTQMVALKFLSSTGSGMTSNAIKAIDYFTNASKMAPTASDFVGTNNSWGGGSFTQSMLDAIVRHGAAGNLFVAAAGNGGSDSAGDNNDLVASYPSNYSTQSALGWDAVIGVASMTSAGALSSFSNYGDLTVDLAAPGSSITSTLPNGTYGSLSGTSMASPHVMGALALIAAARPNATPQECLDILMQCITYKADLAGKLAWDGWLDIGKLETVLTGAVAKPSVVGNTLSDTALKIGETATVRLTFSEAVTGFSKDDVSLSLPVGTFGEFTSTDNLTWVSTLTPLAGVEGQGVRLSIAADSYTSLDGTRTGQAFTSSTFAVDTIAPSVAVTLSDSQITSGETATVTFTFTEIAPGFDTVDVVAQNGTIANLASSNGRVWTATYTPTANVQSSVNSISVLAGSYTDAGGNAGAGGTSANFTISTSTSTTIPTSTVYGTDGSDILAGTASGDTLNGVPSASSQYGRNTIDTLTGNGGTDLFVLGTAGRVFYDDGASRKAGTADFAKIMDFTAGIDDLQLAGGRAYAYAAVSINGSSGLGIYWDQNGNGMADTRSDELVGMLVGVKSISASDIVLV